MTYLAGPLSLNLFVNERLNFKVDLDVASLGERLQTYHAVAD